MRVTAMQGDTLDMICYRHLGRTDMVEAVLEANHHLSSLGTVLPMGTIVVLPDQVTAPMPKKLVQLWD